MWVHLIKRLLHLKNTYFILCCFVDIEANKIRQIKKKKYMLDSENQKQSLTDAFEYRCS